MSDKFERDPELDELLKPAMDSRPSRRQMADWQSAVKFEMQQESWFRRQMQSLPQLVAGLALGFLIASWYFRPAPADSVAESVEPSATILHVFANAD